MRPPAGGVFAPKASLGQKGGPWWACKPAMAVALAQDYELAILDLDPDNLGRQFAGATVRDGATGLEEAAAWADVLVSTGSTLSNLSLDEVRRAAGDKPVVFFGITIAGAASLLGLERFCALGH